MFKTFRLLMTDVLCLTCITSFVAVGWFSKTLRMILAILFTAEAKSVRQFSPDITDGGITQDQYHQGRGFESWFFCLEERDDSRCYLLNPPGR